MEEEEEGRTRESEEVEAEGGRCERVAEVARRGEEMEERIIKTSLTMLEEIY